MPESGWLSRFQCGIQTSNTYLLYGRGSRPGSPTTDYIIRQSRFSLTYRRCNVLWACSHNKTDKPDSKEEKKLLSFFFKIYIFCTKRYIYVYIYIYIYVFCHTWIGCIFSYKGSLNKIMYFLSNTQK